MNTSVDIDLNTKDQENYDEENLKEQLAVRDKRTKIICIIVTIIVVTLLIVIIAVAASENSDHCHSPDCNNDSQYYDVRKDSSSLREYMTATTAAYQLFSTDHYDVSNIYQLSVMNNYLGYLAPAIKLIVEAK